MKEKKEQKSKYIFKKGEKPADSKYIKNDLQEEPQKKERRTASKIIKDTNAVQETVKKEEKERFIRQKVEGTVQSSYFLESLEQSKTFLKENRTFTKIYATALSFLLVVAITFFSIFNVIYNKNQKLLNARTAILNELQGQLDQENLEYISEVLLNPTIYQALDSQRRFEQYLFNYDITIYHGGSKYENRTFKNNYMPSFSVWGTSDVRIVISENYTSVARKYLDLDALRMFSLFVSPIKTADKKYALRDYRTFLNIEEAWGYFENGEKNYEMTVNSIISDVGNGYEIILTNFIGNDSSMMPSISFSLDYDKKLALPATYESFANNARTMTTNSSKFLTNQQNFEMPLAVDSVDESALLKLHLNSIGIENLNLTDFLRDEPLTSRGVRSIAQGAVGANGIMQAMTAENKFYIKAAINGSLYGNLKETGIQGLKNALNNLINFKTENQLADLTQKSQSELFTMCEGEAEVALNDREAVLGVKDIYAKLPEVSFSFSQSDITQFTTLYNKYIKDEPLTQTETKNLKRLLTYTQLLSYENQLARAQTLDIIKKGYGVDYSFYDNILLQDLAENYAGETLSEPQKSALNMLLSAYSDEKVAEISLYFYIMQSMFKNYNIDSKLELMSLITIRKAG